MGLSDTFFESHADAPAKNARIAELIGRSERVSEHLRSLVSSIELSPSYRQYVLRATVLGVRDYLAHAKPFDYDTPKQKDIINANLDAQALHDCIMARAPEINEAAQAINQNDLLIHRPIEIPDSATVTCFYDQSSLRRGSHDLFYIDRIQHFQPKFTMSYNAARRTDISDVISTIAHETAHHMEIKLALAQHWAAEALPDQFTLDAQYYHSLYVKGAYISGDRDYALYENQANERMARSAGLAAKNTACHLGFV